MLVVLVVLIVVCGRIPHALGNYLSFFRFQIPRCSATGLFSVFSILFKGDLRDFCFVGTIFDRKSTLPAILNAFLVAVFRIAF
jgi:hypothetical protein